MRSASPASATLASAQAFCSSDRVRPTTLTPRFAASIARLPQPQPMSSRRWPGCRSRRSRRRESLRRWAVSSSPRADRRQAHPRPLPQAGEPPQREGGSEARRAVGHRRVEPGGVEVVAEVVMRGDVALGLARRIVAQPVGQRIDPAKRSLGARRAAERDRIGREKLEHRHRIGARPFAQRPRLVPADRARGAEPDQRLPALEMDLGSRPGRVKADPPQRAVGQGRLDAAAREAPVSWSSSRAKAGAASRATIPPPTAKPRSALTRCSPRLLMPALIGMARALGNRRRRSAPSRLRQSRARRRLAVARVADRHPRRAAAALDLGDRQDRPSEELAQARIAADRFAHQRIVEVGRLAGGDRGQPPVEAAVAIAIALAPDEVAAPEPDRRRRGEDRLGAAFAGPAATAPKACWVISRLSAM